MHFKASVEYGMRAVLYLAEKGSICSSREVADEMSIPRDYLIQLAQLLRNAGIIHARPGKNGGYITAACSAVEREMEEYMSSITLQNMIERIHGKESDTASGSTRFRTPA